MPGCFGVGNSMALPETHVVGIAGGSQGDAWGIKPESRGDAVGDQVGDGWGMVTAEIDEEARYSAALRRGGC